MPEINPESIFVIYNGISNDFKVLENLEVPHKFLKILQKPYILYIGARHVPHKNFKLALKIISQQSCFNLVLVGGLPLSREELDIFTKLKIKEKIIHLSNITTEELNIIYNKAFCLLYPSLYEGFGIPIIEAQKCGCPVIALNNSSISEVSGEGAILFQSIDVDEIIHEIYNLQNTSVRNNLINKGFVNAKRFSWEKTYYETFKLYKDLYEKS
jgi:mannosyltransferase